MSRKTLLPLALLLVVTVVLCAFAANWRSDKAFVYPDIKAFNSTTAKKRACHVSAEEAENMTTRALVETVVTYPYLVDMYAFDSPDLWFSGAKNNLPMLKELCGRPDAAEVLREFSAYAQEDVLTPLHCATLIGCMERDAQQ
ncbi:MAG: hypothetical protein IJA84_00795 [Clostridia bacterium]|nr:hypothetical protein [Clostridia bacterium]